MATASRVLAVWAGLAGLLVGGEASACSLTVTNIGSTAWTGGFGRGYDVYDSQRRTQLIGFRVRTLDVACTFFLTIAPVTTPGDGSGNLVGPGAPLRYELYKDASGTVRLKPLVSASANDVFSGVVPTGPSGLSLQFVLVLPPEQVVRPGSYADQIEFSSYEGPFGAGILRDRRRVSVTTGVPAVAEISFTGGGSFDPTYNTYSLNFGNLKTGDRRIVGLKARGNGGYRLRLASQNGGRLLHVDKADGSVVAYGLTANGAQVTLTGGGNVDVATNSDVVPATGILQQLEFSVGDLTGASSGDYKDVINVTVLSLQ